MACHTDCNWVKLVPQRQLSNGEVVEALYVDPPSHRPTLLLHAAAAFIVVGVQRWQKEKVFTLLVG
jgi:hypothetical protein